MEPIQEIYQPTVLFGATTWWPLSARLAMAFIRYGFKVSAICPPGHPLRFVTGIEVVHPYRRIASLQSLRAAILAAKPDLVVPCDDGVVWQLHDLHQSEPKLRPLIVHSLGPAENNPTLHSRLGLLHVAAELGIRVPATQAVDSENDVTNWGTASAVLKLDGTWGGVGVEIAHSPSKAVEAFRRLSKPLAAGVALKRFLVNRDLLAFYLWHKREKPCVTIQQFIPGRPANAMFACWRGEILSIVTVEVLCAQGATGASLVVRLVKNDEIEESARLLARRFALNGFHGLDFILKEGTGEAYLIELNPRCTQLGHLRLPHQGDLAGALCARLKNEAPSRPKDPIDRDVIAFFPQALSWNPVSPYLHRGYHDVPWEEPGLVRELLREPWPNRQWPARIYHSFRPPKRQVEVNFDCHLSERTLQANSLQMTDADRHLQRLTPITDFNRDCS